MVFKALAHDRAGIDEKTMLKIREEIFTVLSKYVVLDEEAVIRFRDRCRYITNEERKRGTKAKIGAHEFDRSGLSLIHI